MTSDMMKGGLRYKRLKRRVKEELADEGLVAFFIGTAKEIDIGKVLAGRGTVGALSADEYVLAVTRRAVHIIEMDGLGVVSAKLGARVAEIPLADATASLTDGAVTVDGRPFQIFPWHDEDAEAFVRTVAAGSSGGAPPA